MKTKSSLPFIFLKNNRAISKTLALNIICAFLFGLGLGVAKPPQEVVKTATETLTIKETVKETIEKTLKETITTTILLTPTISPTITEVYSLKVLEVVLDAVSEEGYNYYIMALEAKYLGDKSWSFNPIYIMLLSDAGYKYDIALTVAMRQSISSADLGKGEATKGQIAFKLPKNEKPTKLIYDDKLSDIKLEITDIPEPTKQVSDIYSAETNIQSKYSLITAVASLKNTGPFYSGETIKVDVEISYSKWIGNPEAIQIQSIKAEGFEITKIDPNLPVEVKDGEKVVISLELKVPQEGYKGNIKLIIGG
jgi:hypothetical protein